MQWLKRGLSAALLIFSWTFLFWMLTVITGWSLAPWDTIFPIPEGVASLELALNHFFDVGMGQYLFAVPAVLLSAWVWWRTWQQGRHSALMLAGSNILFVIAFYGASFVGARLNEILFPQTYGFGYPETIGYHLAVLPFIGMVLVFAAWTWMQQRILQGHRKSKTHRKPTHISATVFRQKRQRLTAGEMTMDPISQPEASACSVAKP